jgi:hypothetical protein
LKEYSAKKYGRDRRFVDAEMAARLWMWFEDEEENNTSDNSNETQDTNWDGNNTLNNQENNTWDTDWNENNTEDQTQE